MKRVDSETYKYTDNEPYMRSCPKCNSAHKHLWKTNRVHWCFSCGRYWLLKRYLDDFSTPEEFDEFMVKNEKKLKAPWNCSPVIMEFEIDKSDVVESLD